MKLPQPVEPGQTATGSMPLESITLSGDLQMRVDGCDASVVAEYATAYRNGAEMPRVLVFWDGERYYLVDGFHRYAAAEKAERTTIEATVRRGSLLEARVAALSVNHTHGLRRTNADKRKAVIAALALDDQQGLGWSTRKVAKICGVSHQFVANVQSELGPNQPPTSGGGVSTVDTTATNEGGDESDASPAANADERVLDDTPDVAAPAPVAKQPVEPAVRPVRTRAADGVLRDRLGQPVRDDKPDLVQAFTAQDAAWTEYLAELERSKRAIKASRDDALALVDRMANKIHRGVLPEASEQQLAKVQQACQTLDHAMSELREAMYLMLRRPYVVCPLCGGEGCQRCELRGWLTQQQFQNLPHEAQRLAWERAGRLDEYEAQAQT